MWCLEGAWVIAAMLYHAERAGGGGGRSSFGPLRLSLLPPSQHTGENHLIRSSLDPRLFYLIPLHPSLCQSVTLFFFGISSQFLSLSLLWWSSSSFFIYIPKFIKLKLLAVVKWLALFRMCPSLKLVSDFLALQVAVKMFNSQLPKNLSTCMFREESFQ